MPNEHDRPSRDYTLSHLDGRTLIRLGVIGVAVLFIVVLFAWVAGYLTPNHLTPTRFTDAFTAGAFFIDLTNSTEGWLL